MVEKRTARVGWIIGREKERERDRETERQREKNNEE
jgi:hypothetical protein